MKTFVIATDRNYMMQAEVTIKSILLNVPDAKIYVMNEDLPAEWFKLIRSFGVSGRIMKLLWIVGLIQK